MYIINELGLLVSSLTAITIAWVKATTHAHKTPQPSLPQGYVYIIKSNRETCPIKAQGSLSSDPAVITQKDRADNEERQGEQHRSHWLWGIHNPLSLQAALKKMFHPKSICDNTPSPKSDFMMVSKLSNIMFFQKYPY